jgi:hypothetical protein
MSKFPSAREAKELLVSRIVEEADREGTSLSELERKMLYFSETGWTLPDIDKVSEAFDNTYDQGDYEKKIARLLRHAAKRARKNSEYDTWWKAIRRLQGEDHYLLVMIRQAGLRPPGDLLKLWATALVLVILIVLAIFLADKYGIDLPEHAIGGYIWLAALVAMVGYYVLRAVFGESKVDHGIVRLAERVVRGRTK